MLVDLNIEKVYFRKTPGGFLQEIGFRNCKSYVHSIRNHNPRQNRVGNFKICGFKVIPVK